MTSLTPPTRAPPPRWLTPAEREDRYEAAMNAWHEDVVREWTPPPPPRPMSDYERDDLDSEKQIEGLQAAIAEMHFEHTAPAVWARALERGRYPSLHSVGKRAGRVGADRFRGRYHPHLIYDRDAS